MENSQQTKNIGLATVGLLVIGAFFFIRSQSNIETDNSTQLTAMETKSARSLVDESDEIVELVMSNYKFDKDVITVKAGQTITVELNNVEGFHDFVIDELNVASEKIAVGQKTSVTFTIPENAVGQSYEYYCSVGGHRGLGMVGLIVIE